jgi:predicted ATPase
MAVIEGFRVQNYRALRDVTLGKLSGQQAGEPLTPFTVVIGKNGVGKSTLFDAFGFVADCLSADVESACDVKQRGGFERLRSMGVDEPIRFEIYYREAPQERPITYELAITLDASGRPFVESEVLKQRRKGQKHGRPYPFLRLNHGKGMVWAGEEAVEVEGEEDRAQTPVELTDTRQLGIATLGTLKGTSAYQALPGFPQRLVSVLLHPGRGPQSAERWPTAASEHSRRQHRQRGAVHGARAQSAIQGHP